MKPVGRQIDYVTGATGKGQSSKERMIDQGTSAGKKVIVIKPGDKHSPKKNK